MRPTFARICIPGRCCSESEPRMLLYTALGFLIKTLILYKLHTKTSATTFGQDRAIRTTDRSSSKVRTWNCSRSCVNFRFCCSAFACKVSLHRPATVRQSGTLDENCSVSFSMVVEFLIVRFSARALHDRQEDRSGPELQAALSRGEFYKKEFPRKSNEKRKRIWGKAAAEAAAVMC